MDTDDTPPPPPPRLPLFSEKTLQQPIRTNLTDYCSAHDLIAAVTESWDTVVYRLGGQVAFPVKRSIGNATITTLRWNASGSQLAVAWSDGTYNFLSGENGRLLGSYSTQEASGERPWKIDLLDEDLRSPSQHGSEVVCFGWANHVAASIGTANGTEESIDLNPDILSPEDWDDDEDLENGLSGGGGTVNIRRTLLDLPRALGTIDVEDALPRLSAIPSHFPPTQQKRVAEAARFATQSSVDAIFTARTSHRDVLDVLLVCQGDGTLQVLLDETVDMGGSRVSHRPMMHASHRLRPVHAVLSEAQGQGDMPETSGLRLNFVTMPLALLGSPLLSVVSTKTRQLQNLLDYVVQIARCMQHDWTDGLRLPRQWIANINEELEEKHEGELVFNLMQLAMTGSFTPTMLEWLVDTIQEQNHKRWHESVDRMYTNIKNHLFINLLPALDRCHIAASTLRGHARFHEGTTKFEASPQLFTNVIDAVSSLRFVAHQMLLTIQAEHIQFRAFSRWLRVQIDIGVAEPGSKNATETEEREAPNLDLASITDYISNAMVTSGLEVHMTPREVPEKQKRSYSTKEDWFSSDFVKHCSLENVKEALSKLQRLQPGEQLHWPEHHDVASLVNLRMLVMCLSGHCRAVFDQITHWQSGVLTKPTHIDLDTEDLSGARDMRMLVEKGEAEESVTELIAASVERPNELICHQIIHPHRTPHTCFANGSRRAVEGSLCGCRQHLWRFPLGKVLDVKFADNHALVLFAKQESESDVTGYSILSFDPQKEGQLNGQETGRDFSQGDVEQRPAEAFSKLILHSFRKDDRFTPTGLLVGGRKGKKVCVVFGNEGRQWKVLELDRPSDVPPDAGAEEDLEDDDDDAMSIDRS